MVFSPLMTILLWTSLARMWSAPVQPSTISSIRTPSYNTISQVQTVGNTLMKHGTTGLCAPLCHAGLVMDVCVRALTTNCCCVPPMLVRLCVSWCALTSSWTSLGMAPCSLRGEWFAGHRARLRIRPTVAWWRNSYMLFKCQLKVVCFTADQGSR